MTKVARSLTGTYSQLPDPFHIKFGMSNRVSMLKTILLLDRDWNTTLYQGRQDFHVKLNEKVKEYFLEKLFYQVIRLRTAKHTKKHMKKRNC